MQAADDHKGMFRLFEKDHMNYIKDNYKTIAYTIFLVIGFLLRLVAALKSSGILHPDEIYQSIEIAHLIVYGSGLVPPEFQLENSNIESYASSRSWLFPLIFAGLMQIGEFMNFEYHTGTLVMIRVFLAINATLLIPAVKKFSSAISGNDDIGILSAIFVSIWFRIIEFTVRSFSNTFFLPLLFYALYRIIRIIKENKNISQYDHIIFILAFGLATYIRIDLGVIVFSLFVVTFSKNNIQTYIQVILDGVTGWIIGAAVDYQYYGKWFVVPIHWFTFNVIEHNSDIFGLQDADFYLIIVILKDNLGVMLLLTAICIVNILLNKLGYFKTVFSMIRADTTKAIIQLFIANIIAWLIYSNPWREIGTHKETRFIIGVLILTIILFSHVIYFLSEFISEYIMYEKIKKKKMLYDEFKIIRLRIELEWIKRLIIVISLIFIISYSNIGFKERYHQESFADVNEALSYVGDQDNVSAVTILSIWYYTGSYTYLHLNDTKLYYYSLRDEKSRDINLFNLKYELKRGSSNYFIIPYYELQYAGDLIKYIQDNGWVFDKIIDGSVEIWYKAG